MKKIFYSSLLALAIFTLLGSTGIPPQDECNKDITDKRGKMKPWEKGAWETGNYRNVFRDADYKKAAIDAKPQSYMPTCHLHLPERKHVEIHLKLNRLKPLVWVAQVT